MACEHRDESNARPGERHEEDWRRRIREALKRVEKHREEYFAARERLLKRAR